MTLFLDGRIRKQKAIYSDTFIKLSILQYFSLLCEGSFRNFRNLRVNAFGTEII